MLQSMGSRRVGHDWATEQQQNEIVQDDMLLCVWLPPLSMFRRPRSYCWCPCASLGSRQFSPLCAHCIHHLFIPFPDDRHTGDSWPGAVTNSAALEVLRCVFWGTYCMFLLGIAGIIITDTFIQLCKHCQTFLPSSCPSLHFRWQHMRVPVAPHPCQHFVLPAFKAYFLFTHFGRTAWHAGSQFPDQGSNLHSLQRKQSLNHWTNF